MRPRLVLGAASGVIAFLAMVAGYTTILDANGGHYAGAGSQTMWLALAVPVGVLIGISGALIDSHATLGRVIAFGPTAAVATGDGLLTGNSIGITALYFLTAAVLCLLAGRHAGARAIVFTALSAACVGGVYFAAMNTLGLVP